jgi:hypothetical protein
MRWVLRLVATGDDARCLSTDLIEICRPDGIGDIANLGLTLPEAKQLLASVQRAVVSAQAVTHGLQPEQAEGRMVEQDSVYLNGLNRTALGLHASGEANRDLHSLLLQATEHLWDARQERLLAAQSTIPGIVWFVVIAGGALTVAFGSFLGAPSLRMQLAMSAVLAASGALVLILIIALSNPFRGDFRVSTAPFEHILSRMEAAAGQQ